MQGIMGERELTDIDYAVLANFRFRLRQFLAFSESKAVEYGLTPQQHQALLAIRAAEPDKATIGYVAERLILKPHSASGLVDRLEALGMIIRQTSAEDRRQAHLALTDSARTLLARLSQTHREEIRRLRPMLAELLASIDE